MATLIGERLAALVALGVERAAEELIAQVERETGGLVRLRVEAVRVALATMEREGLVECREAGQRGNGPRQPKRYVLTAQGAEEARRVLELLRPLLGQAEGKAGAAPLGGVD